MLVPIDILHLEAICDKIEAVLPIARKSCSVIITAYNCDQRCWNPGPDSDLNPYSGILGHNSD